MFYKNKLGKKIIIIKNELVLSKISSWVWRFKTCQSTTVPNISV